MDPFTVAAHFVAFTCCLNRDGACSPDEAGQYARSHWRKFLPYVGEDLGKFLTDSRPSTSTRTLRRPAKAVEQATACAR